MQDTKLGLSREEAEIIGDTSFYLLKHSASEKIMEVYGEIERAMKEKIIRYNPDVKNLNISSGKIFRGENYRLYPYIMLDYPRLFNVNSVFAFRTMFWWGHEFSFTMHLQGEALNQYRKIIRNNIKLLLKKDVFICVNDTPWQYHFDKENYLLLEDAGDKLEELVDRPFIKLSRKTGAGEYEKMYGKCMETFELFLGMLKES